MHAPPPVRMSLAPDRAWHAAIALSAAVAGANLAAWGVLHAQASLAVTATVALVAAAVVAWSAWWWLRGSGAGVLAWDGAVWQWSAEAVPPRPTELRVMIDLGGWLLLRLALAAPAQRVVWLVASRRGAGALWPVWRAALYAARRDSEPSAATGLT